MPAHAHLRGPRPWALVALLTCLVLCLGVPAARAGATGGTVVAWGSNTYGQLGDGTVAPHTRRRRSPACRRLGRSRAAASTASLEPRTVPSTHGVGTATGRPERGRPPTRSGRLHRSCPAP